MQPNDPSRSTARYCRSAITETANWAVPRALLTLALLVTLGGLLRADPATAQETQEQYRFDIPAGRLESALVEFSNISGVTVSFTPDVVRGLESSGLSGSYTPAQALERLLAGSGLTARFTGATTVTLAEAGVQDGDGPLQLGPITVSGEAESAYGPVEGYRASRSATATRTDAPIMETPASVQVVPEQVFKDQASLRLRDVYRNISGVQAGFTGGAVSATESAIIRGFEDFRIYRNGFRLDDVAPVDLANVERVEVLKGPASVLFGLGEPGGILNVVTKRPVNDTFAVLEQEVGNYDRFRTTFDANARLSEDGTWLGRLNLAYTNDDTFRDHKGIERIFFAPTLTWQPSDATSLTLDFSYRDEEDPFDHGLAFSADGEPVADVSTFLGEPDFRREREEIFAGYTFTHEFSDHLTFHNTFMYQNIESRLNSFRHFGSTNPDNTVNRTFDRSVPKGETFMTVFQLTSEFATGPVKHDALVGVDLRLDPKSGNTQNGPRSRGPFPIDIVNPQFGQFGEIVFDNPSFFESETKWIGVYLQDQIKLLDDRLHILLGGRFDSVDQDVTFITPTFNFSDDQTDSEFTGRVGALYEVTDWLSPYVSVAQSFNPTSPFTTSVDGLDPEEGIGYEGGVKLSFFEGRLTSTLAAFQILKENVPVTDENNPGFSINGGELRSRGFEMDIAGELAPGWQVIANYAFIDTEVLKSDSLPIGSRFSNVPRHNGSLWSSYDFQPGSGLNGFGIGGGLRGASDKLGDNAGSFKLDGFVVADVAAWYRLNLPWGQVVKAQLNINNLFDKEYFESSAGTASVFPGAPRTVVGSISIAF